MSQTMKWVFIAVVLVVALLNPWYRSNKGQPIVTLGLDLRGGVEVLLRAVPEPDEAGNVRQPTPEEMNGVQIVVRERVDPQGSKEIFLSTVGTDRLLLQVPGEENPDAIIGVIGETALMEWVDLGNDAIGAGEEFDDPLTGERKPEFAKYKTILTGADLKNAYIARDEYGKPAVGFEFKPEAADVFGKHTTGHVDQYLAVVLDGRVITAPQINEPIWGGSGIINGSFTMDEVDKLVRQLNAGALPVPLEILSSSVVGPTLGQQSIDSSFYAGVVGFCIVLVFMFIFYRLPGAISNITLALYVVVVLGFLSLVNATLTLPGIAGFLLSVGMAIDANIIVYERLKEELRWGKTLRAALEASFARGWGAIIDGQVATLLGAAVLYFFGTGPVKGFAVTLFVGNVLALFTGVFVTRVLLETAAKIFKNPSWYAPVVKGAETPREQLERSHFIRFVERSGLWLAISGTVIAVGILFVIINFSQTGQAFNLGIDYTGGEKIILETKEPMPVDGQSVAEITKKYAEGESTVQVDERDPKVVSIRLRLKESAAAEGALDSEGGNSEALSELRKDIGNAFGGFVAEGPDANPKIREQNYVGPTVGRELVWNAIWSLLLGCGLIMVYILMRFGQWPFSLSAVIAILHNVLITLAVTAIFKLEVNASFIAVVLTIIGYSINDTIIIFDRVRENIRGFANQFPMTAIANLSLTQTLTRSFNTVLMVMIMTATLMIFGGENLRDFMIAMLAGLLATAYSSICIATPIMLWLGGGRNSEVTAPSAAGAVPAPNVTIPRGPESTSSDGPAKPKSRKPARRR